MYIKTEMRLCMMAPPRIIAVVCLFANIAYSLKIYPPEDCFNAASDSFLPPASTGFTTQFEEKTDKSIDHNKQVLKMYPVPPPSLGLEWKGVGTTQPAFGVELDHEALQLALVNTSTFTMEEWTNLTVTDLHVYSFVKVAEEFFVPVVPADAETQYQGDKIKWHDHLTTMHDSSTGAPPFSVDYDASSVAFLIRGKCIITAPQVTSNAAYSAAFAPTTDLDIMTNAPINAKYRHSTGIPRIQIRFNDLSYMTALMAVDTSVNITQQFLTMQHLVETTYLPTIVPGWRTCLLTRRWHPYVREQSDHAEYLASNLTFTWNQSSMCTACPPEAPHRDRALCTTIHDIEADDSFQCSQPKFCSAKNLCVEDTHRDDADTCQPIPRGYYSVQAAKIRRNPLNNPAFYQIYKSTYLRSSNFAVQYKDKILAIDPVGTDGKVWRVELFLDDALRRHGVEAVVADFRAAVEPMGSTLTWTYATFALRDGGSAQDKERLVFTVASHRMVGPPTRTDGSRVFQMDTCFDFSHGSLPPSEDGFSADPGIMTSRHLNSDGMTLFFNNASKTQADINGSNARIWQEYLNTKADNVTVQYDNGTYTIHAPCILYYPSGYDQTRLSIIYDTLALAVQRQNTGAPLIRILWEDEYRYIFSMQIDTENNTMEKFLLMQKTSEKYILDVFHPRWRTCFVNARWLPFSIEHAANVTRMVASFTFDRENYDNAVCNLYGAEACPPEAPHRDVSACVAMSEPTGEDSFLCSQFRKPCLETPTCAKGQFSMNGTCAPVPDGKYSVMGRVPRLRPQGSPIFDALFALITTSINLIGNILDIAPLDTGLSGWVLTVSMDDALQARGVGAVVAEIEAAVTGTGAVVTHVFARFALPEAEPSGRRRLLQTDGMEDPSRLLVTITSPSPSPPPPTNTSATAKVHRLTDLFRKSECLALDHNFLPTHDVFTARYMESNWYELIVRGTSPAIRILLSEETSDDTSGQNRNVLQAHLDSQYDNANVVYENTRYIVESHCILVPDRGFHAQQDSEIFSAYAREVQRRHPGTPFIRVVQWNEPNLTFAMQVTSEYDHALQFDLMQATVREYFLDVFYPRRGACLVDASWSSFEVKHDADADRAHMVASFAWSHANIADPQCNMTGDEACPPEAKHRDIVMCAVSPNSTAVGAFSCFEPPTRTTCLANPFCAEGSFNRDGRCVPVPSFQYSFKGNLPRPRPQNSPIFDTLLALVTTSPVLGRNILDIDRTQTGASGAPGWVVKVFMDDTLQARGAAAVADEIQRAVAGTDAVVTFAFARIALGQPGQTRRRLLQDNTMEDTGQLIVTVTDSEADDQFALTPTPSETSAEDTTAEDTTATVGTPTPTPSETSAEDTTAAAGVPSTREPIKKSAEDAPTEETSPIMTIIVGCSAIFLIVLWCALRYCRKVPKQGPTVDADDGVYAQLLSRTNPV